MWSPPNPPPKEKKMMADALGHHSLDTIYSKVLLEREDYPPLCHRFSKQIYPTLENIIREGISYLIASQMLSPVESSWSEMTHWQAVSTDCTERILAPITCTPCSSATAVLISLMTLQTCKNLDHLSPFNIGRKTIEELVKSCNQERMAMTEQLLPVTVLSHRPQFHEGDRALVGSTTGREV